MFSAFTRRVSPTILRQNIYSHISRAVIVPAHHSRLFTSPPSPNLDIPTQPPSELQLKRDASWGNLLAFENRHSSTRLSPEETWSQRSQKHLLALPPSIYAGRSVSVKYGDISRAMNNLSSRLKANRVQKTWRYQMRHEKKGVKRRRLESERWRRRFADEIRRKIELVRSIQRRGQ